MPNGFHPITAQKRTGWYRQKKPYDLPLVYNSVYSEVRWESCSTSTYFEYYQSPAYNRVATVNWNDSDVATMYNKAYAKLLSKLKKDSAELGAGFAEFRKTAEMVNNRSFQLWQFMRAVRRGRFGDANFILNVPKNFRPKARGFGGAVLEYSFGWAPTVGDIYNGMKTLTSGVPPAYVSTSVAHVLPPRGITAGIDAYGDAYSDKYTDGYCRVSCGAMVRLTNPNLWLANQLGLINPVGVMWELLPFSFLLDYVLNVGDVINSWSDTMGIDTIHPWRTYMLEVMSTSYRQYGLVTPDSPCYNSPGHRGWAEVYGHAKRIARDTGLPGPSLRFTAPNVSLTRAATSISLLLQLLKGK